MRGEIVIADNGSTDGSQAIAEKAGVRVVPVKEKGYGSALIGGVRAASGKWIIMGDADDSYDFSDVAGFVKKFQDGDELVMGCRLPVGGGTISPGAMPWKNRWLGNPVLSFIGRLFFKCPAHDFHSGLRGFTKTAFEKMDLQTTGMEFASEMVIKSTLKGLKISEVPITLHKDGRSRPPHLKPWRDGWRHLRFMLLFSPRWLFLCAGPGAVGAGNCFRRRAVVRQFPAGPGGIQCRHAHRRVHDRHRRFSARRVRLFYKSVCHCRGIAAGRPETVACLQRFHAGKGHHARPAAFLLGGMVCSRTRSGSGSRRTMASCPPWRTICAG